MHTDTVFCLLTDKADVLLHGHLHRLFDEAMQKVLEENDRELPGFLEYTKLWVEKVNRGGLFLVDDY